MRWKPHVTVAAVVEQDGKFLLVEEKIRNELLLNQPAGHLDANESLIDAVIRETLEETAWEFLPESLVGIYQWQVPKQPEKVYIRFTFSGSVANFDADRELDTPIVRTIWSSYEDIVNSQNRHRSPQLLRCVDDYRAGVRIPLSSVVEVKNHT